MAVAGGSLCDQFKKPADQQEVNIKWATNCGIVEDNIAPADVLIPTIFRYVYRQYMSSNLDWRAIPGPSDTAHKRPSTCKRGLPYGAQATREMNKYCIPKQHNEQYRRYIQAL